MSGKIEVKIRLGKSMDSRYDSYPEWFLEITDEEDSNKKVKLSPNWIDLKNLIREVKVHELRIDKTRDRKNDADKWEWAMREAIEESQTKLNDFDIPEIYYKPILNKKKISENEI